MTSVSQRCWVNKYPLEGIKYLIWWEHSIPAHPAGPFAWGVMASGYHLVCFACPWNAAPQHSGEATSPSPAAKSSWKQAIPYCKTRPALSRVSEVALQLEGSHCGAGASARFPMLPCRALRRWKCGSLPELIISELPRGLVGHGAVLTQLHCCRFLCWPWMGVPMLRSIAECSYACSDFLQVVTKVFNSLQCK